MSKITKNAVLYKEMTTDMKKPKIMLILVIVNMVLYLITFAFLLGISIAGETNSINYRILAIYYICLVFFEIFLLGAIIPAITAGSISLEKERQTLDVLLTTKLKPWDIIWGKYLSQVVVLGLLVLSTLPLMAVVFTYGGLSFLAFIEVLLCMIVFVAFVSSFGIFFSSLTKNTISAVILSYVVFIAYSFATIAIPTFGILCVEYINNYIYENIYILNNEHLINADFLAFIGYLNPFCLIFDVLGNTIGYSFGDEAGIKGWIFLSDILPHMKYDSNMNIFQSTLRSIGILLFKIWTPVSIVVQLLITFIILKFSAFNLNPMKFPKKKKKRK